MWRAPGGQGRACSGFADNRRSVSGQDPPPKRPLANDAFARTRTGARKRPPHATKSVSYRACRRRAPMPVHDQTRSGKPVGPGVRTARRFDLELIVELPYGLAAIYWPHQRPDRWLHPDHASNFLRNISHLGGRPQMGPGRRSREWWRSGWVDPLTSFRWRDVTRQIIASPASFAILSPRLHSGPVLQSAMRPIPSDT